MKLCKNEKATAMFFKKRSNKKGMKLEEEKVDLTPMIDVTFLLLIFFVFNMSFVTEEGKIDAYLPKNGHGVGPVVFCLNDVRIKLLWKTMDGQPTSNPNTGHVVLKVGRDEYNQPGELDTDVENSPVWAKLGRDLMRFKGLSKKNNIPVIIDARQEVPHQHVMSALNQVIDAEIKDVTFAAPELPY
jgi:biopolymer transport protein ExbD